VNKKKVEWRPLDRYVYRSGDRGVMLPSAQESRQVVTEPLWRTDFAYGNGLRSNVTVQRRVGGKLQTVNSSLAGPAGQTVRLRTSEPVKGSTARRLVSDTVYGYTDLNEVARSTRTDYSKARKVCSKARKCTNSFVVKSGPQAGRRVVEGRRAALEMSEYPARDILGRRYALLSGMDVLWDGAPATRSVTRMYYSGEDSTPYAEWSTLEDDPNTRWLVNGPDGLVGETRQDTTRYITADQQGSVVQTMEGLSGAKVTATFDFDSYGKRDPDREADEVTGTTSGSPVERAWTDYSYTGMRRSAIGDTTNHQARDYNAQTRGWLQTDQYLDPWQDLALSLDPGTRDRHAYAGGNPVGRVDLDGHCSMGDKASSTADKCSQAMNDQACEKWGVGCASASDGVISSGDVSSSGNWGVTPSSSTSKSTDGANYVRPTAAATATKIKYGKAAHLASWIDGAAAWAIPGGAGYSEARDATLDASVVCKNMRSFGNGFLGGPSCTTAYGSLIPIPGAPGEGSIARASAKELAVGVARHEVAVIGRREDTAIAKSWARHEVLDISDWTLQKNDEWVRSIIDRRMPVYVASPTRGNLFDHVAGRPTVLAREREQLLQAGYTQQGDYLIPPR
jgi:hypothetical protein